MTRAPCVDRVEKPPDAKVQGGYTDKDDAGCVAPAPKRIAGHGDLAVQCVTDEDEITGEEQEAKMPTM